MNKLIEKLKQGKRIQRLITYCGMRVVEFFQPSKDNPGTYDRYFLPSNRDKSRAVLQNSSLTIEEVEIILTS